MLYLTYNNKDLTDGAGAQLQRILSIYLIAKYYGVGYIHHGIDALLYQGVKCMETNTADPSQIAEYNVAFHLESDPITQIHESYVIKGIHEEHINMFKNSEKNVLLTITLSGLLIDSNPSIMNRKIPYPWMQKTNLLRKTIKVAIHVRRGELYLVDSSRMLPNEYYIDCMNALKTILEGFRIPYEFHLYTEQVTAPVTITPGHHGICNRIDAPITLKPEDNHLEDFQVIPNIIYHINESPLQTLKDLTMADILLASRSSFSYVAAILKPAGLTFFHPFWHCLSDQWIPTRSYVDIYNNIEKIISLKNNF